MIKFQITNYKLQTNSNNQAPNSKLFENWNLIIENYLFIGACNLEF